MDLQGLDIAENTHLDVYVDGAFKTFRATSSSVVNVEKGRSVIIKLRPSFLLGLDASQCPGLDEFVEKQSRGRSKRRHSPDPVVSPAKRHCPSNLSPPPVEQHKSQPPLPPKPPRPDPIGDLLKESQDLESNASATSRSSNTRSVTELSSKAKGKKPERQIHSKWPTDYYVCEVRDGLKRLKALKDHDRKSRLDVNFPVVFDNLRYSKTTFSKWNRVFDAAIDDATLRDVVEQFIKMGKVKDALWPKFAKALVDAGIDADKAKPLDRPKSRTLRARPSRTTSDESDAASSPEREDEDPDDNNVIDISNEDDDTDWPLCAYCDELLPKHPSQELIDLGIELLGISEPDPSEENQQHRNPTSYVLVQPYCERHRVELHDMSSARLHNWPLDPDFSALYDRVTTLRPELSPLLSDMDTLKANGFFAKETKGFVQDPKDVGQKPPPHYVERQGLFSFTGHGAG